MRVFETAAFLIVASTSVGAFSTHRTAQAPSTSLNLFGKGGEGGENKGAGMMDQIAMFKKAQEMAQKKAKIDEELKKMEFAGEGADGKVKAAFKYVPVQNPMDPNPDYEAVSFDFDADYYESASNEELAEAVKECIASGVESTNKAVAEKYAVLQGDLMAALGQKPAEAADAES